MEVEPRQGRGTAWEQTRGWVVEGIVSLVSLGSGSAHGKKLANKNTFRVAILSFLFISVLLAKSAEIYCAAVKAQFGRLKYTHNNHMSILDVDIVGEGGHPWPMWRFSHARGGAHAGNQWGAGRGHLVSCYRNGLAAAMRKKVFRVAIKSLIFYKKN